MARATLKAASDRLPGAVAVDSSFLLAAIYDTDPRHGAAWPIYEQMVASGVTAVVCQPLLLIEAWNVLRRLALDLSRDELRQMIEDSRERAIGQRALFRDPLPRSDAARREYAMKAGEALLLTWLAPVPVARVRLTYRLLASAQRSMTRWGLRSHDATWLAVAQETARTVGGRPSLATVDDDFDRVDGLDVWGRR